MQIKKAASVLPEPVGAEISVVFPARMWGQPSRCGSVGVPKRLTNQSRTSGWAHSKPESSDAADLVFIFLPLNYSAAVLNSQTKLAGARNSVYPNLAPVAKLRAHAGQSPPTVVDAYQRFRCDTDRNHPS